MFYFLIMIGIILVAFGLYRIKISGTFESNTENEINELNNLRERIENIENILFFEEPVEDSQPFEEEDNKLNDGLNLYKKILGYEEKNYSMEEICSLLNMKKGEVILLKNLYKNYPL